MIETVQTIITAALPVVLAITLHEAAHGYVARHFGDPTAWQMGRVTLNPLKHIDPLGTIVMPLLVLLLSGGKFVFGYAKPVPVDFGRLKNPKRDMLWVAAAGPAVNFLMALVWAMLWKLAVMMPEGGYAFALFKMSQYGVVTNVVLMVLNLLPLPPLDGGRIAVSLLPMRQALAFSQLERWGFPILLVLMFTGVLGKILNPLVDVVIGIIGLFVGI